MSSLRFTTAPARPAHFSPEEWSKSWIGLEVGLATVYPMCIGYLGRDPAEKLVGQSESLVSFTQDQIFNSWSDVQWNGYLWISRGGLIDACTIPLVKKPLIMRWLEEEGQLGRKMFAVPESAALYLP
jgi:hypothetical protein